MTPLESAALRYVRARIERDEAKKALRAGWHLGPNGKDECEWVEPVWEDAGGYGGEVMQMGKSPPCYQR